MRFYTIQNENVLISDNEQALKKYYDYVFELPEDYEKGKYIIGEKEEEIEVPDYDEDGNPIIIEYEETEIVIDYDEGEKTDGRSETSPGSECEVDGNEVKSTTATSEKFFQDSQAIGNHEIVVTKHRQSTHTEIVKVKMLVFNPAWEETEITRLKNLLNEENTKKAKQAVEQGYVEFNDAKFETNSQTVSDLTSAMLIMKESEMSVYPWLSMDDKYIELTLEDFGTLGSLIAGFKAQVWNTKYIGYKTQIALAQTIEELKEIEIEY